MPTPQAPIRQPRPQASSGRPPAPTARPAFGRAGGGWPAPPGSWERLGLSFGALPSPPALTAPLAALTRYDQHLLMAAAWLESTGTALYVIFGAGPSGRCQGRPALAGHHAGIGGRVLRGAWLTTSHSSRSPSRAASGGRQTRRRWWPTDPFAATEHVFSRAPPLFPAPRPDPAADRDTAASVRPAGSDVWRHRPAPGPGPVVRDHREQQRAGRRGDQRNGSPPRPCGSSPPR